MEMKQYVNLEVEKDGHNFRFMMPSGVKVITAYAAAYDCLTKLFEMLKEAQDQATPPSEAGEKKESECRDA